MTVTSSASPCSSPLYQFWVLPPGGGWTVVQPYSTTSVYSWDTSGLAPGTYQLAVWAKQQGSAASFEWSNQQSYSLTGGGAVACNAVSETPTPPSPQARDVTVQVIATAGPCSPPEFQFWL